MTVQKIRQDLEQLANLRAKEDVIRKEYQQRRGEIINDEQRAALEILDFEEIEALAAIKEGVSDLTKNIKHAALAHGESVKSEHMQVLVF